MSKSPYQEFVEAWKRGWNFRFPSISFSLHGGSGARKGFRNPFLTERERERRETQQLYDAAKRAFDGSPFAGDPAAADFMFKVVVEACEREKVTPSIPLGEALYETVRGLLIAEGAIFGFWEIDPAAALTIEEGVELRDYLNRKQRFLGDADRLLDIWREKVIRTFGGILGYLPASVFDSEDESEVRPSTFTARLVDLCETPAVAIERTIMTMFDGDVMSARLFDAVREQLDRNARVTSGIRADGKSETNKPLVLPTQARKKSNAELVETYLAGTPFKEFFDSQFPFRIPYPVRFEHSLVVGGTGHGKTQLLQLLIHHDLEEARTDGRSIIVIDSQGDLIRTISHLAEFSPTGAESLADRLIIVDPNDVEYPISLNMFDWHREGLERFSLVDREKILNGTIELYEYFFGALLGAELTQKQGVIFRYLARLMMEIPGATVHTLRQLMENGEAFREHMQKLPATARSFFETRFFDRSFSETKKQILTRLWGVLSNATLERMFSYPRSKVNLFEATNSGKIILINTAKELLKQEGCAIFGRFFIALIAQAAIQRAALPSHERRPTFIYIDEAQDYFDQNIEQLLNQARKYRMGMVLAHQNLDQLGAGLRSSVLANTSIKFAGGVSAKDASTFAAEMRCDSEFIQAMRKRQHKTDFACFVRNLTPQAIGVEVPLGYVESLPVIDEEEYEVLVGENRAKYCARLEEIEALNQSQTLAGKLHAPVREPHRRDTEQFRAAQPPATLPPEPAQQQDARQDMRPTQRQPTEAKPAPQSPVFPGEPLPLGRGGKQHKYLQQVIKQAAEERNFRAVIEEPLPDGGRVDVSLTLADRRIACEISVTTAREQELGNIEKCLGAGYGEVVLIASQDRHLSALEKFIVPHLDESERDRVRFLKIEDFVGYLDELSASVAPTEATVRGYKVRVTRKTISEEEARARRQAIGQVIARSLKQLKDD